MSRGLYVHIPFCVKKCDYCDFVSFSDSYSLENEYVDALISELLHYKGEKIDTVFIGGGTPTSLKTESLTKILDEIFKNFSISKSAEITVECNPKTADKNKLSSLLSHGANRLSIGVQSLDDSILTKIGRIHTASDAKDTILLAKKVGFNNISADIMFGLPGQTREILRSTIDALAAFPVTHISCYGLILEENTLLYEKVLKGEISLPSEDEEFGMYKDAVLALSNHGFLKYEISNFARETFASKHNIKYWKCGEYIGIGAAAHSFYKNMRFNNITSLCDYIKNPFNPQNKITLTNDDKMSEFMFLGLRMDEGVCDTDFSSRFGISFLEKYKNVIEKYIKCGLLEFCDNRLRFTPDGVYVSNTVLCEFM